MRTSFSRRLVCFPLLLVGCAVLMTAGCGKSAKRVVAPPVDWNTIDQASVQALLRSIPAFIDSTAYPHGVVDVTGVFPLGPDEPLHFERQISRADEMNVFAWSDSDSTGRPREVHVHYCKYEKGNLHIVWSQSLPDSAPGDDTIDKVLAEDWFRDVWLRRGGDTWYITHTSAMLLFGNDVFLPCDTCRSTIHSVRLQISGTGPQTDTTYTSLTSGYGQLFVSGISEIPHYEPGQPIDLTVVTTRDDDLVTLHGPGGPRWFTHTGLNTYAIQTSFTTSGFQNLMIAVEGRRSVASATWANDLMCWGLPLNCYQVVLPKAP